MTWPPSPSLGSLLLTLFEFENCVGNEPCVGIWLPTLRGVVIPRPTLVFIRFAFAVLDIDPVDADGWRTEEPLVLGIFHAIDFGINDIDLLVGGFQRKAQRFFRFGASACGFGVEEFNLHSRQLAPKVMRAGLPGAQRRQSQNRGGRVDNTVAAPVLRASRSRPGRSVTPHHERTGSPGRNQTVSSIRLRRSGDAAVPANAPCAQRPPWQQHNRGTLNCSLVRARGRCSIRPSRESLRACR